MPIQKKQTNTPPRPNKLSTVMPTHKTQTTRLWDKIRSFIKSTGHFLLNPETNTIPPSKARAASSSNSENTTPNINKGKSSQQ